MHRARILDRFLDYLAQKEWIPSYPIADLRSEYRVKSSRAICAALLEPKPDEALESRRQPQPFASVLGDLMRDHVARMRVSGFRYETQTRWLLRFDRFLQKHPELACEPVSVMLQHWCAAKPTANHKAECERLAGVLNKAQHHLDPSIPLRRPDPRPRHTGVG